MWADYQKERHGYETIEVEGGFICFDVRPPNASIEEFYVRPDLRGGLLPKRLADQVFKVARSKGAKVMWARVTPGIEGAEHALRTNLHYGFKLAGLRGNDILLAKEIGD